MPPHPQASALVDGERHRLLHVGFGRNQLRLKARRDGHAAHQLLRGWICDGAGLRGIRLQVPEHRALLLARERRGGSGGNEIGFAFVENEIVEIDVPPRRAVRLVDETDEDFLSACAGEVDDLASQNVRVGPGGTVNHRAGRGIHDFDAGALGILAAAHHVARPRLRNAELRRREPPR